MKAVCTPADSEFFPQLYQILPDFLKKMFSILKKNNSFRGNNKKCLIVVIIDMQILLAPAILNLRLTYCLCLYQVIETSLL